MLQALGHLLPIAVAVAFSSVPITATLLILLSPKRNKSAIPFLAGWVFGMALMVVLFSLVAQALPETSPYKGPALAVGIGEIIVGVALVVFAIVTWRRARNKPRSSAEPRWMRAITSFGALPAFGISFALNLRPKGLLLGIASGLAIHAANLTPSSTAIVIAIYTIIGASTVGVPIIVTLASPTKMQPRLVTARTWLSKNSHIVTVLIMLMVGVVIIGTGLSEL